MSDNKTSLLISQQVPEFIREDHPTFVAFLEAYYEYLETKQGVQINDLYAKAKKLKDIPDVDESLELFEQNFFNNLTDFLPKDVEIDKEKLLKQALPLYLAKGSENGFKLLFRMLFGQELVVNYPRDEILRASDGNYEIDNAVRVANEVYATYTGDGSTTEFQLIDELDRDKYKVYLDDVLQTETGTYFIKKESKTLVFLSAPADGVKIEVLHEDITLSLLVNRKLTGVTSGATALVERVNTTIINEQRVIQLFVNSKTLNGTFQVGENITSDILIGNTLVGLRYATRSTVLKINITDGGASYNVGDPVIITSATGSVRDAKAIVESIFSGSIDRVTVRDGGAGFQINKTVSAAGFAANQLGFTIGTVDSTATNTATSLYVYDDVISDIDPENVAIDSDNWNFTSNVSADANTYLGTRIADAFGNLTFGVTGSQTPLGEIDKITITANTVSVDEVPVLDASPASIDITAAANTAEDTTLEIREFGSLGKLVINNPGLGYAVGDELVFTNVGMSRGQGAEGEVLEVDTVGGITKVGLVFSKIQGTAAVTATDNVMVQGTGTVFTEQLKVGDTITINNVSKIIDVIASDTSLNVDSAFSTGIFSGKPVRHREKDIVGGSNYQQSELPTVTISTSGGTGGNVSVTAIMGDGEDLFASGSKRPGEIQAIELLDGGTGINTVPSVDLTGSGDGLATATAELSKSFITFEGRFRSSDSILSSQDRKLQGRGYYVPFSYVTVSETEFAKYKTILKNLIHPAGFAVYGEWNKEKELIKTEAVTDILSDPGNIESVTGTVNVANDSIYVTGTNTSFNVANSLGIISTGAYIAVNTEIRVINSIISNTNLEVTSAFTITANNEEMVVMNVVYDAISTEDDIEIMTENRTILIVEE